MSPKCSVERRTYPPGQHGKDTQFRRGRSSDYSTQLREKQKARRIYGILERQFRRYFYEAQRSPGLTGANLLGLLETRLDNAIYRLGLADSRPHALQLVSHDHFDVNGIRTDIALFSVRQGVTITVHGGSRNLRYFLDIRAYMDDSPKPPEWLLIDVDGSGLTAQVSR